MPQGKLEVLLVGAKGLQNTDCLSKMDPYCILTCRTQQRKSSVATGQGTSPNWNENFIFTISEGTTELKIKIMDSDMLSADDFVGEASIPLHSVFEAGSVPQTSYNVIKDHKYYGEIRLTLAFKPEGCHDHGLDREGFGGWRHPYY